MSKRNPVHVVYGYIEGVDNFVVSGFGKSDKAALRQARETGEKEFGQNEGRVAYYYIRFNGVNGRGTSTTRELAQSRAWNREAK